MATKRVACLGAIGGVLLVTACGSQTAAGPAGAEATPEPRYFVVQPSDLPPGWALVPGERLRVSLGRVLGDPWNAGFRPLIRRERVAGAEISFWSPERQRIECEAAVYRSTRGAREVFTLRARSYEAFLGLRHLGQSVSVRHLGEATSAYRLEQGWRGFVVSWRYRNVLSSCRAVGLDPVGFKRTVALALLQQRRISRAPR